MFEYVFRCYKADICDKEIARNLKQMSWVVWGVSIAFICLFFFLFYTLKKKMMIPSIIVFIFICLADLLSDPYENNKKKKERHLELDIYLSETVTPLQNLLKSEPCNLYNNKGIDWLVSRCNEMIDGSRIKSPFAQMSHFVLPFITLFLGAILVKMDSTGIAVIFLIVVFFYMVILLYQVLRTLLSGIETGFAERLLHDLEYIRLSLPDDNPVSHDV